MPRLRKGVGGGSGAVGGKPSIVVPLVSTTARTGGSPACAGGRVVKKGIGENVGRKNGGDGGTLGGREGAKKLRTKFPERLEWKMTHLSMPTTSTPKRDPRARKLTKEDIETAFGFDDSCDGIADYSTLLSPIVNTSPRGGIIPPVWKTHPLSQRNADPAPVTTKQLPIPQVLKDEDGQERRSPRLLKERRKVIKIPSASTSKKITPVPILPPKEESTLGEFQIPSTIEITLTPPPPEPKVTPEPAPVEVKSEPKPKRPVRSKKPVTTTKVEAVKPMPTRVTRSRKVATTTTTSSTKTKAISPPPQQIEADDEETPIKPVTKRKPVKKTAPSTTTTTKKPTILQKKPHVLPESKPTGTGNSPFSQLLHRYTEEEPVKEPEFFVDPKKIVRTYGSRKRIHYSEERDPETDYDFVPKATQEELVTFPTKLKAPRKGQKSSKKKGSKKADEGMDEEERKWLEEKNKEFEEVLKTKLVIEQSFSD